MKLNENTNWISAKTCTDGSIITFLDEGAWIESTKFTYDDGNPVKQFIIKVKHEGDEKQITLIKGSRTAMIEAYGDDTLNWIGKQAKINLALNTKGTKSIMLAPVSNGVNGVNGVNGINEETSSIPKTSEEKGYSRTPEEDLPF